MFFKSNKIINVPDSHDFSLKTLQESKKAIESDFSKELPKPKKGERFLKGPIPLNWLTIASKLPGKALHVALVIWYLGSLTKNRTIKLSIKECSKFGVKRNAVYRALTALESAKLVSVKRKLGRCSIVTVMDTNDENLL